MTGRMPRILLLAAATLAPGAVDAQDGVVAIVGVNVVTMADERVLPRRTVVVRGGRIAEMGHVDSVAVPAGARRIEGGGAFLVPGMIDAHAHPVDPLLHPLYVASGVTTVQYLNAFPEAMGWTAPAGMPGPRVEACAGPVSGVRTAEEARRVVAEHADAGFRCIKPYDDVDAVAYPALIEAARARGMRTVSHARGTSAGGSCSRGGRTPSRTRRSSSTAPSSRGRTWTASSGGCGTAASPW